LLDLEERKRAAIEAEDFDTAKAVKAEIDRLKRVAAPPAARQPATVPDAPLASPARRQTFAAPPILNIDEMPAVAKGDALREFAALQSEGREEIRPPSEGGPHPLDGCGVAGYHGFPRPPPVPSAALGSLENETIAEFFGEYVLACLLSRDWKLREAAICKMANDLKTSEISDYQRLIEKAIFPQLRKDSDEKNMSVFLASQNLLCGVEKFLTAGRGFRRGEIHTALDPLLERLLDRVGDANRRIHDSAVNTFNLLSHNALITPQYMCMQVVRHLRGKVARLTPKAAAARGGLLVELVRLSGESGDLVAVVAGDFIKSAAPEARAAGMSILKILKEKIPQSQFKEVADLALKDVRGHQRESIENEISPVNRSRQISTPQILSARISVDGSCQFCGLREAAFALDGQALDAHYLKKCPALQECHQCGQIVEKSGLAEHLESDECSTVI